MTYLYTVIQLILCCAMIVIVLSKKNLPAKNWLLVFIFSLLTSALVLLSMQFYISSDLFITNTGMGVYSFLGVMRSILDIVGWGALVLFILSFRNTPIEAAQENNQNTDKVNEYIPTDINTDAANSSEVSTAQYLKKKITNKQLTLTTTNRIKITLDAE